MSFKISLLAGALALVPSLSMADMMVSDPYARAASPVAISGAAFMAISNPSDIDDRVVSAASDVAERVELHTHIMEDGGVMRMVHVEEGFALPAGETIMLERGSMHVMFLGLRRPLTQGDEIEVTLTFEHAAPVTVTVPVDLERQPAQGGQGAMNHGTMGNGTMTESGSDG